MSPSLTPATRGTLTETHTSVGTVTVTQAAAGSLTATGLSPSELADLRCSETLACSETLPCTDRDDGLTPYTGGSL